MDVSKISPSLLSPTASLSDAKPTTATSALDQVTGSFQKTLDALSAQQQNSDSLMAQLAAGENVDVHQVMMASAETDVNFRIAMAIRDQLVQTYQEMMRMSV
jgi:flagellar hook-basal body complex protein FliE